MIYNETQTEDSLIYLTDLMESMFCRECNDRLIFFYVKAFSRQIASAIPLLGCINKF